MSLIATALTTLTKLKLHLGISASTHDSLLEQLIDEATIYIEGYCNRVFASKDHENILFDGDDYDDKIYLSNFPITAVTKIEYNNGSFSDPDWTEYETTEYEYNLDEGIIYFDRSLPSGKGNLRITYTAGYATIPQDLELACNKLVGGIYNSRKSEGVNNESLADRSVTWQDLTKGITKETLDRYKNYTI